MLLLMARHILRARDLLRTDKTSQWRQVREEIEGQSISNGEDQEAAVQIMGHMIQYRQTRLMARESLLMERA